MKIKRSFVIALIAMSITACGASKNNEPIDAYNFDTKTQTEQNAYINKFMGRGNPSFSKFNLDALEKPQLPENELKIKEEHINTMLIQCAEIIGIEKWEEEIIASGANFFSDKPFKRIYEDFENKGLSVNFRKRAQPHALSNKVYKCTKYLFKKNKSIFEDLFEYSRILSIKEKQVEKLYKKFI